MPESVRVGVVGTSWYADMMHLPNLKSHSGAHVVAICGRNRDRAAEIAHKYDIPQVFTDYRALIEQGQVDAVVVATPDDTHYPITMAALDAGLHVLCEKPLALTAQQAKEMYETAEARGVTHMTFFTWRWVPPFPYLRHLVEEGYVGRPFDGQWRYLGDYGRVAEYSWRFDGRRAHGALGDLGAHMIDLARWYVGDIARVCADLRTFVERPGVEGQPLDPANDAALLLLEFQNGAHGLIQVSVVAHVAERGQERHVLLHGEAGTLEAELTDTRMDLRGARHDEDRIMPVPVPEEVGGAGEQLDLFSMLVRQFTTQSVGDRLFIEAILEDQPVAPSFYDGFKAQQVLEAALESQRTGCWVAVS